MKCTIHDVSGFELNLGFYLSVTVHSQEFEALKLLWNQKIKLSKMMLQNQYLGSIRTLFKGL